MSDLEGISDILDSASSDEDDLLDHQLLAFSKTKNENYLGKYRFCEKRFQ